MKISIWLILFFLLGTNYAFGSKKRIILVEEAADVHFENLDVIANTPSKKAADDGYLPHFAVIKCFAAMKYYYTGGRYNNTPIFFRLHKPQKVVSGKKYPLIISLHGAAESGNDNKRQLSHLHAAIKHLTGPESCDFYCLVPQCPKDNNNWTNSISNVGKGDAPIIITLEILDAMIQEYPIDKDRISILGICSGGMGAWAMAGSQPNRFASIVVCSTSGPSNLNQVLKSTDTAIWAFNNTYDHIPIEPCRKAIDTINQNGGQAYLTEAPVVGHDTWAKSLREIGVIKWMSLHCRKTNNPPPGCLPGERSLISNFLHFFLPISVICSLVWYIKKHP